jgi:hypothetical protein
MEIEGTTFGTITIDGKTYEHDVIIRLSGEVVKRMLRDGVGSQVSNAGRRLIGDGPSVPRGGIARCNKGGNPPYHLGSGSEISCRRSLAAMRVARKRCRRTL